jgi:hypothetical protein
MSRNPRTALTGVPSGDVIVLGTPKNARKYSDAESRSISRSATRPILADGTDLGAPGRVGTGPPRVPMREPGP